MHLAAAFKQPHLTCQARVVVLHATETAHNRAHFFESRKRAMLYAILAYHVEADVVSWTKQEDDSVMSNLQKAHERLNQEGRLGPAARLGATSRALTLRGPGNGTVIDGPFAETKEQLLGLYVLECAGDDAAVEAARELRRANPSAVYEIRPIALYLPGQAVPKTQSPTDVVRPKAN